MKLFGSEELRILLHFAGVPDHLRAKLWFEHYKGEVVK